MTKAQTEIQDGESGFEPIFQGSLGLPIRNTVTEYVKKLQDAITEQQEKASRLMKENNTYLFSKHID